MWRVWVWYRRVLNEMLELTLENLEVKRRADGSRRERERDMKEEVIDALDEWYERQATSVAIM